MINQGLIPKPADIINFAASSTDISRILTSFSGKNNKKPDVGSGVVGKKTDRYTSLSFDIFKQSPFVSVDTKQTE